MTLVDSNVLVDVLANDPTWLAWSAKALEARSSHGALLVNEIVYAELAVKSTRLAAGAGYLRLRAQPHSLRL